MRRHTTWRLQNNLLHVDLFERSSQSPDTTKTSSTMEPTEPIEMARNNEVNAKKRLTRIHVPLNRWANFRLDSHVMSMLHIFHGKPYEDPNRHVDELSQVCEINQIHNVFTDVMKMKIFPATHRDQAKD